MYTTYNLEYLRHETGHHCGTDLILSSLLLSVLTLHVLPMYCLSGFPVSSHIPGDELATQKLLLGVNK